MDNSAKRKRRHTLMMVISTLILIVLVVLMMHEIYYMQGNARIVNYSGIVRGATQRLIKNELYGKPDDSEIARLDDILFGLRTGGGSQRLTVLKDDAYHELLSQLSAQWETLKEAIYSARKDASLREAVYTQSESYFNVSNDMVNAAEVYSDGIAGRMKIVEFLVIADLIFITLLLSSQVGAELRLNRSLRSIAYIDPNTGLPNKRSCDEKLKEGGILAPGQNVCCMMFDLNNLKRTNDTMGHEAGDALIGSFSSLLRRTAPSDMFIGRFGGDEFIGIQMNADKGNIAHFVESLRKEANRMAVDQSVSNIHLSFACGYAFSVDHNGCSIMTLMDIADKNMYQNKSAIKAAAQKG